MKICREKIYGIENGDDLGSRKGRWQRAVASLSGDYGWEEEDEQGKGNFYLKINFLIVIFIVFKYQVNYFLCLFFLNKKDYNSF